MLSPPKLLGPRGQMRRLIIVQMKETKQTRISQKWQKRLFEMQVG